MPKSGRRDEKAWRNGHAGEDISPKVEKPIRTQCSMEEPKDVALMKAMRNALAIGAPASQGRSEVALLSWPRLMVGGVIIEQGSLTAMGS